MVNVSDYTPNNKKYIKVSDLQGKSGDQKRIVVIGPGEFKEFTDKEGKTTKHLWLPVQWMGEDCEVKVNRYSSKELQQELGPDTEAWVGAVLQMSVTGAGNPYISLVVIKKPDGGVSTS
jgi:hypothetical protein